MTIGVECSGAEAAVALTCVSAAGMMSALSREMVDSCGAEAIDRESEKMKKLNSRGKYMAKSLERGPGVICLTTGVT